jgi:hypothetical protein
VPIPRWHQVVTLGDERFRLTGSFDDMHGDLAALMGLSAAVYGAMSLNQADAALARARAGVCGRWVRMHAVFSRPGGADRTVRVRFDTLEALPLTPARVALRDRVISRVARGAMDTFADITHAARADEPDVGGRSTARRSLRLRERRFCRRPHRRHGWRGGQFHPWTCVREV